MAGFPVSTAGSARPRLRTTSPRASRTTHAGSGCAGSHISASVPGRAGHTPLGRGVGGSPGAHTPSQHADDASLPLTQFVTFSEGEVAISAAGHFSKQPQNTLLHVRGPGPRARPCSPGQSPRTADGALATFPQHHRPTRKPWAWRLRTQHPEGGPRLSGAGHCPGQKRTPEAAVGGGCQGAVLCSGPSASAPSTAGSGAGHRARHSTPPGTAARGP